MYFDSIAKIVAEAGLMKAIQFVQAVEHPFQMLMNMNAQNATNILKLMNLIQIACFAVLQLKEKIIYINLSLFFTVKIMAKIESINDQNEIGWDR